MCYTSIMISYISRFLRKHRTKGMNRNTTDSEQFEQLPEHMRELDTGYRTLIRELSKR